MGAGAAGGQVKSVASFDGVRLDYEVVGNGPPVVCLHGGFAGRRAFDRQRPLADRFRLILPSARGHDGADGTLPADYGVAASDVRDVCAVLDAEGLERAHVIGHSYGGAVAFALAHAFPHRVDSLILIEPSLLALLPTSQRGPVYRHFRALIDAADARGDDTALEMLVAWLGGEAWQKLENDARTARLKALAPLAHIIRPHLNALLDFEVKDAAVIGLEAPTLLIYGGSSFDFETDIARRLRELRPDFMLAMVEGAGHNVHRDDPGRVNAEINAFLTD